jgi:hypothetical protein
MTISEVHFEFATRVKTVVALNNPQKYLGLHYKKVLEFWNKIENLTQDQLKIVNDRFWDENFSEWDRITDLAIAASYEVVGEDYADKASSAVYDVTKSAATSWATRELIGGVENPTFIPMFDNL